MSSLAETEYSDEKLFLPFSQLFVFAPVGLISHVASSLDFLGLSRFQTSMSIPPTKCFNEYNSSSLRWQPKKHSRSSLTQQCYHITRFRYTSINTRCKEIKIPMFIIEIFKNYKRDCDHKSFSKTLREGSLYKVKQNEDK